MKCLKLNRVLHGVFIWILYVDITAATAAAEDEDVNTETELINELLGPAANYDRRARPRFDAVNVSIECVFESILELDELSQQLEIYSWFIQIWADTRLRWDPSRFRNQTRIILPASDVWLPDIAFRNSVDEAYGAMFDRRTFRVIVISHGDVIYVVAGKSTTTCLIDVTYFPFDSQACYVELNSWMYRDDQLIFHLHPKLDTTYYRTNGVWELVDTATVYRVEDGFATARFIIYIRRKPQHFVFTLVSPCILLSLLMCLVFLLPAESDEKISLQITVVLSFTVFQLVLSSSMPQTSDFVPIIAIYVYGMMYLAGMSLFCTVAVLHVHHRQDRPVPPVLRFVVHVVIGRMLCMTDGRPKSHSQSDSPAESYSSATESETTPRRHENPICANDNRISMPNGAVWPNGTDHTHRSTDHQRNVSDEWIETARIIDRFFLVVFVVTIVIMSAILLIVSAVLGPRKVEPISVTQASESGE